MSDERAIAVERIEHMVEAADAIAEYVARGRAVFDADQAVRDAILTGRSTRRSYGTPRGKTSPRCVMCSPGHSRA